MKYGYARVSSKDQNLERQVIALKEFGVDKIFMDKESGKDFNRAQYKKMIRKCNKRDLIVIVSIDRLGRNYNEILEEWRMITKENGIDIAVLDMPLLDTRQSGKDLTGTFVADLVLQILSYVAETERENIRKRQKEGIDAAKNRGIKFGRPLIEKPAIFSLIKSEYLVGNISSRKAAALCGISQGTFLNWIKRGE